MTRPHYSVCSGAGQKVEVAHASQCGNVGTVGVSSGGGRFRRGRLPARRCRPSGGHDTRDGIDGARRLHRLLPGERGDRPRGKRDDTRLEPSVAERAACSFRNASPLTHLSGALFELWSDPANLPRLLPYLRSVDAIDDRRVALGIKGPAGSSLEWDAEMINEVPLETIGWRSLPGADVASAGSVRFRPAGRDGTEVTITMRSAPPAGRVGAAAAWLTGHGGVSQIREALQQLKQRFEENEEAMPMPIGFGVRRGGGGVTAVHNVGTVMLSGSAIKDPVACGCGQIERAGRGTGLESFAPRE